MLLGAAPPTVTDAPDATEMLRRADEFRNPLQNFSVDVFLTLLHKDETRSFGFRVYGNGYETSLLEFRTPASDKGKYYLMLRGDMWIYLPNTSRPIRISPLQRLAGEASNGDVARTNYSADYTAELGGEETVEGRKARVLELKGRDPDMSYARVKLWVEKPSCRPIQAEFYAMSGRLLKRAYFRDFEMPLGGRRVLSTFEIQDAIRPDHRTRMVYSNLNEKQYPEKMFNRNYMGKW
jgi:hypothetical protein